MDIVSNRYSHSLVKKFGHWLISNVRDKSIEVFDAVMDHKVKDPILPEASLQIIETLTEKQKELLVNLVPDIVTYTIGTFLLELEQSPDIDVLVRDGSIQGNVRELSDGLLSELFGSDGWVKAYSTKRVSPYYDIE